MMNQMRRGASSWVARIFLGALAVSFVGWGIADVLRNRDGGSTILSAGETRVSVPEFQLAYRQGLNRLSQQLQRRPSTEEAEAFGLDQAVLSQLTAGALLDEQARRLGVGVSDDGLIQLIQNEPAFKDQSGNFSRNTMRAVLANAQITEQSYLEDLRGSATRNQLIAPLSDGATVPAAFLEALGAYNGERRTVNFMRLTPPPVDSVEAPTNEALDDFYTQGQDGYRAPEYRGFSYLSLSPAALADPAAVTDDAVAASYGANRARYTTPERRQVAQIVFADRASADRAVQAMASGTSFADAAITEGRQVADLGLVPRSAIPNATLADAAFSATLNTPTAVVDGPFGPVIMQVREIAPEVVRPLDEVRDEVRNALALEAANAKVTDAYNAISEAMQNGAPLAEAAQQAGYALQTVAPVDASGNPADASAAPDLPAKPQLLAAVFAAQPGMPPQPVNYQGNNYVFIELGDVVPARDRPLAEVRDRVVADWKVDEAERLMTDRAEALAERIRGGQSLADVAAAEGLTVETAAAITRESGRAEIGEAATRAAFSGPQGTVAEAPALESGQAVVLQVTEVADAADPAANVPAQARQSLDETMREDLFQSYVAYLQGSIPVSLNNAALQQAKVAVR
ncbi:SurA N-terminal domain-containing protein [Aureimonas phyllosphaerae]|uniref:Parvulin-like PPIase n=1 Tax=Aureimonas phyllosphaerae TaxID=1166078 RepID=A0A7W6FTK7_9HYPH|nr:SurA N-terminal domain-containing protein [Aureimonas phyllosphaerae]MBB3934845.1 peptidyl-prolyl cis-trans isomerase D [Aureimonas phyllosphaerae]MBB3957940.1 peptidyl-prolyl cis-trans isomerase D [Aureimonas phyllosphaerae]SFF44004.1 peptidyl-prolyl cis-trans isomerase D [Aureimonas phyllosphaerae]